MSHEGPEPPVVGIGASAGGLSALGHVVAALPRDSGFAFILLQHQAESQVGKLAAILAPLATLPLVDVAPGAPILANHIYVVPPHTRAVLVDGSLVLEPTGPASPHRPIDDLLSSIASHLGPRCLGVILSGTGNDGTEGLRAIQAAGGVTVAQDPTTAEYDGMPRSAIAAGVVDLVLSADRIGREIATLRRTVPSPSAITRILDQLRDLAGIDFSTYKRPTIERRLERQVARHHLETLDDYATYLAEHPAEARALYEDLLVHTTEFFRDRAALDQLVTQALPPLLAAKPPGTPLRVWVAGCSTGEEVYSIAILLLDALAARDDARSLQLFGTDLSERAVAIARAGRYPMTIREQVSEAQLAKYFVPDAQGFRVVPSLRERCVFVRHDLAVDPPFSRLDVVSCRNVLIYMGAPLRKRIITLFHYALEQPGFLLLGSSESITEHEALFSPIVTGTPLFRRKPTPAHPLVFSGRLASTLRRPDLGAPAPDLYREADHVLLARYAPACVLVDESFDIVQFRGRTGAYLEPAPGIPQLNVFKMARDRLGPEVRTAAMRAQRDDTPVRVEGIVLGDEPDARRVDIEVVPLRTWGTPKHYLIVFEEHAPAEPTPPASQIRRGTVDRVDQLEQELAAAREYLSTVIAQHVATGEELGILNEELQSTNEELQSSNEELRTAKEELQSTNDELGSVNAEIERRNVELQKMNDDLVNVLASVDVAIIIVDGELRVRRFTPKARALFKLIETDVGRPIADLQPSFPIADLGGLIGSVIESLAVDEREVQDAGGHHYRMQVRPYRTSDQQIGGAVISFVDVTVLRESIEASRRAREAERTVHEAVAREKDAFLNAVSHELRTPLSAILLWTEVIRHAASAQPDVLRAIDTIEASARAEAQLVEDLLDLALSRTNTDALLVAVQPTDPNPVVETTVATLRPSAEAKRVALALDLDRGARALADPRRLRQIAWHLVTNAIKFTPPEGHVTVHVGRRDGVVELKVTDSGKGVGADYLENVFEPFSQEDPSSTRKHPGLGIGLAFVRHLVERQGGTITAASGGEGAGASFTVRLPSA